MPSRPTRTISRSDGAIARVAGAVTRARSGARRGASRDAQTAAGASVAPVAGRATLGRLAALACWLAVPLVMVTPIVSSAQAPTPSTAPARAQAPRTHVVSEGETLWSLASRYLGDGHRWEEIVAVNRGVVSSARRLTAGTRLVLPAGAVDALPVKVANGVAALPSEGSAEADLYARYAGRTVFYGTPRSTVTNRAAATDAAGTVTASPTGDGATARERLAAPWLDDDHVAARAGRVVHRLDIPAVAGREGERELHLYDRVSLASPAGAPAERGREYLAIALGDSLSGHGRVVVPLGVVRVLRVDSARQTSDGVIVAKFGAMEEGVLLLPNPGESRGAATPESQGANDARGAVIAVVDEAVLPTLQHMVLLDVGASRGVRAGDRVTFFRDAAARDRSDGAGEVARGIVMRVSSTGASALIVQQSQPALGEGTPVRIARPLP